MNITIDKPQNNRRMRLFYCLTGSLFYLLALAHPGSVSAQANSDLDPVDLVRVTISDVTEDMRNNEDTYADQPLKLRELVEQQVASYFNFPRMTQLAMGKNWKLADDKQKEALTREFKTLLIRSYTHTLFTYRYANPDIQSETSSSDTKTQIKLRVKDQSNEAVTIFLRMEKSEEGWQVIDVNVEGVSLIITARSQFDEEITKTGVEGLIQSLVDENMELAN